MKQYDFTLVLAPGTELTDELVEALYESGCDDGSPGSRAGDSTARPLILAPFLIEIKFTRVHQIVAGRAHRTHRDAESGLACSQTIACSGTIAGS